METKVRQYNYITILGWMISDLKLKGNALLVYAIIYGFSQTQDLAYTGSRQYLADWTNSTLQGVSKCLKKLVENNLIVKKENIINGVKFCEYRAVVPELLPVNKVYGGRQQSLHNNIEYNNSNNIHSVNFDKDDAFERFWAIYPRHTNKKKAYNSFVKKCNDESVLQKMLSAIVDQKETEQWQNEKFIPHPTTWLNGERWEDEIKLTTYNNKNNEDWMCEYE